MLEFTGERFIPSEGGEIRYEHMHRYCWAQALCRGRTVLDIACGEGYGSALLAQVAESVIGVDISQDAVNHASRNYSAQANLRFIQGSATRVPVDDASVDVLVSFETLEHLAEQEQMLGELRRVLKPSGILVISSPNKQVYSDDRNYVNEFHVKELYFDELDALLHRHFGAVRYFGQRFLTASALLPVDSAAGHYEALLLEQGRAHSKTFNPEKSMYFVAVCAASEDMLPVVKPNLFIEDGSDLYSVQQDVMRWASGLDREHKELAATHVKLQSEFDERTAWALRLDAERQQQASEQEALQRSLVESASRAESAEKALAAASASSSEAKRELAALTGSRLWRLMTPFRWLGRLFA
ncbi:hypothetical protein C7T35_18160 [Variovorax sp. WS11]|uniref:class I SAM-dependent methyltransferase n=1 Tax=Variovorax sp. WS11 TaxID=1105204 RepID=UPI000D0CE896|nr:class I SAM-dependent methyltransferase [Variovorax sp. WS11]NDZ14502.1 class I SAM-dependent methyltransferase [Variovorax sp. WS11]PSL83122.1 hypothetical protein C7T35_18160 [Variovorax sp. WS11]